MEIERSRKPKPREGKKFRIQSKSWFLTYPKLDKSKEGGACAPQEQVGW